MEIFTTYGAIKSIDLPSERVHPEFNRGFVYIEYENPDDAEKAIKHMDGGEKNHEEELISKYGVLLAVFPSVPCETAARLAYQCSVINKTLFKVLIVQRYK